MTRRSSFLLVLAVLLPPALASAGANRWTGMGPWDGFTTCLAAVPDDPRSVFAGTTRGVFRSRDSGLTWTKAFSDETIEAIVVSRVGSSTVYAAAFNPKLLVGMDGGECWFERQMPEGLPSVTSLAVDRAGSVYAGTESGALRSTDGGETWTQINRGLGETYLPFFRTIAAPTSRIGIVYAGTSEGIYRTIDGGENWIQVSDFDSTAIRIDLAGRVYASTIGNGVVASADGLSWQQVEGGEPLPSSLSALAIDPLGNAIWTAETGNVFTWTAESGWVRQTIPEQGPWVRDLEATATEQGATGLAATDRGVFRQNTDGTWIASRQGLRGRRLFEVVGGIESGKVYVSDGFSVLRTENRGLSWSESPVPGAGSYFNSTTIVAELDVLRAEAGPTVFAGTTCFNPARCFLPPGLWRSQDGGASWEDAGIRGFVSGLAVSPRDKSVAYVSRKPCFSFTNPACGLETVLATEDGGEGWALRSDNGAAVRVIDPDDPAIVYGSGPQGLRKSIDGGRTWTEGGLSGPITRMVMTTAGSRILYAFRHDFPNDSLFRSFDGGTAWELLGSGPPTGIESMEVDPYDGDVLFAGTHGAGVFRSSDRGVTWQPLNLGVETLPVYDLRLDPTGRVLYAATEDGAWALEIRTPRVVPPR